MPLTANTTMPASTPRITMTIRSSIRVKPDSLRRASRILSIMSVFLVYCGRPMAVGSVCWEVGRAGRSRRGTALVRAGVAVHDVGEQVRRELADGEAERVPWPVEGQRHAAV